MAIPSRQIGWGTEDNLLWQISKQLEQLTNVTYNACANNAPTYKVFTALLTQSGGNNLTDQTSGTFTIGVSYNIDVYLAGDDFSNIGGPPASVNGAWDGAWFIATGTTPLNYSNGSLTQWNTGAPVATVLENTIGNIWFTYISFGYYTVESNGLFIIDKSLSIIGTPVEGVQNNNFAGVNFGGDSQFSISVVEPAGVNVDDLLYKTPIEIRVYN